MGRPRTPTKLLELRGSFKHDPKRELDRAHEPTPTEGLGGAPAYFTDTLMALWVELVAIAPAGVLGNSDRWLVELACQLMLKFRTVGLIPQVGMTGAELAMLVSCLGRMGMSPADRSRVGVTTDKDQRPDELAKLRAETSRRPN